MTPNRAIPYALATLGLAMLAFLPAAASAQVHCLGSAGEATGAYHTVACGNLSLAALPGAVALFAAGKLLQGVGDSGKYSDSLGLALQALALPAFTLAFLAWMVRERGLAHAHFRWTKTRREALARFIAAPPSPLERREKLEQLRGLEMGLSYWAAVADEAPISVDNPADLEAARACAKDHDA